MTTRFPGYVQPSPDYVSRSPDYPAPPVSGKRMRGEVEVTARVAFGEAPHSPSEMYAYRAPLPVQPFQPVRTVANPEPVLHFLQVASQQPSAGVELVNRIKQREVFSFDLIIFIEFQVCDCDSTLNRQWAIYSILR
jgi:hypothetical protein